MTTNLHEDMREKGSKTQTRTMTNFKIKDMKYKDMEQNPKQTLQELEDGFWLAINASIFHQLGGETDLKVTLII